MPRKSNKERRISLFERGNNFYPICLTEFTQQQVESGQSVTLEHVPINALGGTDRCLTCENCNTQAGRGIDHAAAINAQNPFYVTTNILGKHGKFELSHDGKTLTHPFARYSKQDLQNLENSESKSFTMSIRIPDPEAVATSSLKSAYLALFSLMGPGGGYAYARSDAIFPVRQKIMSPTQNLPIENYVATAPNEWTFMDILLVSEPLLSWIVKIADHLVFLPLYKNGGFDTPLLSLKNMVTGNRHSLSGAEQWNFARFGTYDSVTFHLVGATDQHLVGRHIGITLPNGHSIEGTCISHHGESVTLLCSH